MERKSIHITYTEADQRLDRFLRKTFPLVSMSEIYAAIRKRFIRINGTKTDANYMLQEGDELAYPPFLEEATPVEEKKKPIYSSMLSTILFEDEDMIVINKPPKLPSQGGTHISGRTVVDEVSSYLMKKNQGPAHLVHRLDKDTSGVMVLAKNRRMAKELGSIFKDRSCVKKYLGLVIGAMPKKTGVIEMTLERQDTWNVQKKVRHTEEEGQHSKTLYDVEEILGPYSLVGFVLETGRMHQIRVHCSEVGAPLALDERYGDFAKNKVCTKECGLKRQFLHAAYFGCEDPRTGEYREWTAPLPADLEKALHALRILYG